MKGWIITGAVLAGIAILFGAFGAHILKNKIIHRESGNFNSYNVKICCEN